MGVASGQVDDYPTTQVMLGWFLQRCTQFLFVEDSSHPLDHHWIGSDNCSKSISAPIKQDSIPYEVIEDMKQMPIDVKNQYLKFKQQPSIYTSRDKNGNVYVVIHAGQRNTGGYHLEVTKVVQEAGKATIYYQEITPPKNTFVTMSLTYPQIVVKIKTHLPITIKKQ